jgi:hypothetical protein
MADLVDKKPGDDLYAEEVSRVFRGTKVVEGLFASGGTGSNVGGKIHATQNRPYQLQIIEIVEQVEYQGDPVPDLYLGVLRFYKAGTTVLNDDWVSADPEGTIKWLVDTLGTDAKVSVGDRLSAWWHPIRAAFIPVSKSPTVFELKTSLSPTTNTADAWPVNWDRDTEEWATDYNASTFTVEDSTKSIRALGKDDTGSAAGACGWGMMGASGNVLIAEVQRQAKMCMASAKGVSSGLVDAVSAMDDGQVPKLSEDDDLAVENPLGWYVKDDATCVISQNGDDWIILAVGVESQAVETAERVNGVDLQHKTRTLRANMVSDESGWETWHTGGSCE